MRLARGEIDPARDPLAPCPASRGRARLCGPVSTETRKVLTSERPADLDCKPGSAGQRVKRRAGFKPV